LSEAFKAGVRAGAPIAVASFLVGTSFGVVGESVFGTVGSVVMSAVVFAGSAQFASAAVLASGGSVVSAVTAGTLLNLRFLPMGIALAASVHGSLFRRAATGQALIDASWAMAAREGGRFDVPFMLGATVVNWPAWVGGTLLGVLIGDSIGDPETLGLDALFPAFFLALLWAEVRDRPRLQAAVGGAAIGLLLTPVAPAGVPIITATLAALVVGLRLEKS
jgi:4-azaleucine resistance transporter AzlC